MTATQEFTRQKQTLYNFHFAPSRSAARRGSSGTRVLKTARRRPRRRHRRLQRLLIESRRSN